MTALLDIADLSIRAGGKLLVKDLWLRIKRGERLGLIGESGSGKSLTALAAIGLLPRGLAPSGSITLAGKQVIGASQAHLDRLRGVAVATVFQEPLTALDPLMRVGRQIAEPLARRRQRDGEPGTRASLDDAVLALLNEVSLPDPARIARSFPHELSGGQRQRVAIAMALACKPDLLIADEPTTALDVTTQAEILKLLDRLVRERGMGLLFISHDLPIVSATVQRVIVLRRGEAVESGPVGKVFLQPQHDYTKSLLNAARRFDDALVGRA
jgi:peptide/nickel transport system ATP-binding protein